MDKAYNPSSESQIYKFWEDSGAFTPKVPKDPVKSRKEKEPFTIILPLPNASDPMHMGHAMFVIEDILCRYHRMLGDPTLWLPGGDHAGIETQFIFEKRLQDKGKSRFDYDRKTLYQMIWDYVDENRKLNQFQMKELGFSMDWTRYHYSLEPQIIKQVLATFKKLHQDKLLYRSERIVNYCTRCGTAFSDLEIDHIERDDFLYYLDYGSIQIATTRPETIFADVAVAVSSKSKKYKSLIGKNAIVPLINKEIPIIADDLVEADFGTGALKITPAHDATDFEIGQKHKLPIISCIELSGKMVNTIDGIDGLYPKPARAKTLELLEKEGKLVKTQPLHHTVGICYRCKNIIEPLPVPQWYVKTKPLAAPVIKSVKDGDTKLFPQRFKKTYLDWMENIRDWNISRQIVWGPQIPAFYCLDCHPQIQINFIDSKNQVISGKYEDLKSKYSFEELKSGLQTLNAPINSEYFIDDSISICPKCKSPHILQETDTFDTWFLSGQWPLTTLGFNVEDPTNSSPDFAYFYPTSVLDTLSDILFFWVGRMMIFGFYLARQTPFKVVHLHAKVVDEKGQKMSKSKFNVINPSDVIKKYGADALRFALVYGIAPASNVALSDKKVESMRNFVNKIWNAARFIEMTADRLDPSYRHSGLDPEPTQRNPDDLEIINKLNLLIQSTTQNLQKYRFGQASEDLYQFFWHEFCDVYIEKTKSRGADCLPVLVHVLVVSLKLLHPFIPFVTEAVYQNFKAKFILRESNLITASWPACYEI